jgi:hypothetical protein
MKTMNFQTLLLTDLKMGSSNFKRIALIFLLIFYPFISNGQEYYTVNVNELSLRKGPGTNYEKIGILSLGQQVILINKESQDWWKVRIEEYEGYVAQQYLTLEPYSLWDKANYQNGETPKCENIVPLYDDTLNNKLIVNVMSGSDVVVKLMRKERTKDDICIRIVYVRSGSRYEIRNIPEGDYYLKLAYGSDWRQTIENGQCKGRFVYKPSYEIGKELFSFNVIRGKEVIDGIEYEVYEIPSYELTLGAQRMTGNEFDVEMVDEKSFNE